MPNIKLNCSRRHRVSGLREQNCRLSFFSDRVIFGGGKMDAFEQLCMGIMIGYYAFGEKSKFFAATGIIYILLIFLTRTNPSDWGLQI